MIEDYFDQLKIYRNILFQVITAIYEYQQDFDAVDFIKCATLSAPWTVDESSCYKIYFNESANMLTDPGMTTPASVKWKAECGSTTELEAMVGVQVVWVIDDYVLLFIECCKLTH
jgi:hypothetical protein